MNEVSGMYGRGYYQSLSRDGARYLNNTLINESKDSSTAKQMLLHLLSSVGNYIWKILRFVSKDGFSFFLNLIINSLRLPVIILSYLVSYLWQYQLVREIYLHLHPVYHYVSCYFTREYLDNFTYDNILLIIAMFLYTRSLIRWAKECPWNLLYNNLLGLENSRSEDYLCLDRHEHGAPLIIAIRESKKNILQREMIQFPDLWYEDINRMSWHDFVKLSRSMAEDYLFHYLFNPAKWISHTRVLSLRLADNLFPWYAQRLELILVWVPLLNKVPFMDLQSVIDWLKGPWLEPKKLPIIRKYEVYSKLKNTGIDTWEINNLIYLRMDNNLRLNDINSDKFVKILLLRSFLFKGIMKDSTSTEKWFQILIQDKRKDSPFRSYENLIIAKGNIFQRWYDEYDDKNKDTFKESLDLQSLVKKRIPGEVLFEKIRDYALYGLNKNYELVSFLIEYTSIEVKRSQVISRNRISQDSKQNTVDIYIENTESKEESSDEDNDSNKSEENNSLTKYIGNYEQKLKDNAMSMMNISPEDQKHLQQGMELIIKAGRMVENINNLSWWDIGTSIGIGLFGKVHRTIMKARSNVAANYADEGTRTVDFNDQISQTNLPISEENSNDNLNNSVTSTVPDSENNSITGTDKVQDPRPSIGIPLRARLRSTMPAYAMKCNPLQPISSRMSIGRFNLIFHPQNYQYRGLRDRSVLISAEEILKITKRAIPKWIFSSLLRQLFHPWMLIYIILSLDINDSKGTFNLDNTIDLIMNKVVRVILNRSDKFSRANLQNTVLVDLGKGISELIEKGWFQRTFDSIYVIGSNGLVNFDESLVQLFIHNGSISSLVNESLVDSSWLTSDRARSIIPLMEGILNSNNEVNPELSILNLAKDRYFNALFSYTEDIASGFDKDWNTEFKLLRDKLEGSWSDNESVNGRCRSVCLTLSWTYRMILNIMRINLTREDNWFDEIKSNLTNMIVHAMVTNDDPSGNITYSLSPIVSLEQESDIWFEDKDNKLDEELIFHIRRLNILTRMEDSNNWNDEPNIYSMDPNGMVTGLGLEIMRDLGNYDRKRTLDLKPDVDYTDRNVWTEEFIRDCIPCLDPNKLLDKNKEYLCGLIRNTLTDCGLFVNACALQSNLDFIRVWRYVYDNRDKLFERFQGQYVPVYHCARIEEILSLHSMILGMHWMEGINSIEDSLMRNYMECIFEKDDFLTRITMISTSYNILDREISKMNTKYDPSFRFCERLRADWKDNDFWIFQLSMVIFNSSRAMVLDLHYHLYRNMSVMREFAKISAHHCKVYHCVRWIMSETILFLGRESGNDLGEWWLGDYPCNIDDSKDNTAFLTFGELRKLVSGITDHNSSDSCSILNLMNGLMNRKDNDLTIDKMISDALFMEEFLPWSENYQVSDRECTAWREVYGDFLRKSNPIGKDLDDNLTDYNSDILDTSIDGLS